VKTLKRTVFCHFGKNYKNIITSNDIYPCKHCLAKLGTPCSQAKQAICNIIFQWQFYLCLDLYGGQVSSIFFLHLFSLLIKFSAAGLYFYLDIYGRQNNFVSFLYLVFIFIFWWQISSFNWNSRQDRKKCFFVFFQYLSVFSGTCIF
jgi:hypothetical protein